MIALFVNNNWIITLPAAPSKEPEVVKTTKAPIRQRLTPEEWGRVWLKMVAAILVTLFLVGCTLESPSLPGYAAVVMLVGCLAAFGALTYFDDDRALIHRLCRGETPQMQLDRARDELYAIARGSEAPAKETIKVAYDDPLMEALGILFAKRSLIYKTRAQYEQQHANCTCWEDYGYLEDDDPDYHRYNAWEYVCAADKNALQAHRSIVDDYLRDVELGEIAGLLKELPATPSNRVRRQNLQAIIDRAAKETFQTIIMAAKEVRIAPEPEQLDQAARDAVNEELADYHIENPPRFYQTATT